MSEEIKNLPQILYSDKYIVVCKKPVGVLSEEDGNKASIVKMLKEYYSSVGERNDVYTVHRLDRGVSGVMVFARNPKSASILSEQIASGQTIKKYLAVVMGCPDEKEGSFVDLLFRDAKKNKTYVVDRDRKGVRPAKLDYEVIEQKGELSLVKVRLHTGRTHQIRVQFASRKMPLVGDGRYGSRDGGDAPALFSHEFSFKHPKSGKNMTFSLVPDQAPFNLFSYCSITEI
jgi:23S rRNA pseudouridine1911/1915/1917 synthase